MMEQVKKGYVFVDAETDGLYGSFLTVAMIAVDCDGGELERCYYGIRKNRLTVTDPWVRENVLPKLGDYTACENEEELLERVWSFWMKYGENAYAVADVCYPVEARLFQRCVMQNEAERKFRGPFPLLDLSSLIFANGMDPLMPRYEDDTMQHNALSDVENSIRRFFDLQKRNGGC